MVVWLYNEGAIDTLYSRDIAYCYFEPPCTMKHIMMLFCCSLVWASRPHNVITLAVSVVLSTKQWFGFCFMSRMLTSPKIAKLLLPLGGGWVNSCAIFTDDDMWSVAIFQHGQYMFWPLYLRSGTLVAFISVFHSCKWTMEDHTYMCGLCV